MISKLFRERGDDWMSLLNPLLDLGRTYLAEEDLVHIERAYRFAEEAHRGQMRKSGDPFIIHPVAVTEILMGLKMDLSTLIAALLHDVVEDTDVELEEIQEQFGDAVALIVDGLTKLKRSFKYMSKSEHQAENYRKMFIAMAKDVRVVIIKLADRLHNMRTVQHMSEKKQIEYAEETLEIFAPLSHRLGISKIRWELEDLSLRYKEPQAYYRIASLMKKKRTEREHFLGEIIETLKGRFEKYQIPLEDISGRPKHIYSIYRKMTLQHKPFNEIYDLMAVRVIVESLRDCYAVLGIVHTMWRPMPGRFKDYIAMPKNNLYQSLHTTVHGPRGEPIEIQIRTTEMHKTAEFGIAAHWAYKEGTSVEREQDFNEKLTWFREMMELQNDSNNAQEFVESIKGDWFKDTVFVFTPKSDVIELPAGSVPLDFAYRIHTEIGNKCVGSKVNGKIVPLDYKLRTGDQVQIITSKHSFGPSRDWLKLVKSSHARNKIRSWFKTQRKEESIAKGREMIEAVLKKNHFECSEVLKNDRLLEVSKKFNMNESDDLYAAVGYGGITAHEAYRRLTHGLRDEEAPTIAEAIANLPEIKPKKFYRSGPGVTVVGADNVMIRLSRCCNPVPGEEITGFITRGRGVSVHRLECPNIQTIEPERAIQVIWETDDPNRTYQVDIEISGFDRSGLLNDVLQAVSEQKADCFGVVARVHRKGFAAIHLTVSIKNSKHLRNVVEKIKRVPDVISVQRMFQQG
ncbi:GTP pyrophosphokinase [Baia soyae]|uniref:GTP pyrophosphokinase n=2 Tax=Baia soyae TaxID=1544746 RepID=A0A4R2RTP1_9BACL|nr:GTP pyrophosphokinase [Baia soyae]